ncbi:hypothetical protein GH5_04132 [Leishmania sp. Ghana 2012 LV757]|uniref:hypothetical protein n=1 Tax=Leishmania sp. Ghana 2012 LV757 TaxID=2803181 RepID=UPI001B799AC7|nr:hypothetical protein GH5_04132 [Leishmania sp. Ghana 2012 LV757]
MPPVRSVKHETDVVVPRAGETYVADDGTVSQVLDDHIDAAYEPTEEEVLEFADWIGMKLPEDSEFLWIAREGLKTPLPKEWKPCSTSDGEVYYFNFKTGESSWDHPMDGVFRQRFEQEKAGARKSALAAASTAANRSTSGLNSSMHSSSTSVIPQTHVMMTDTGVLRRDFGPGTIPGLSPSTTSTSGSSKSVGTGTACDGDRPVVHYPLQQQPRPTVTTTRIAANTQGPAALSSIAAAPDGPPACAFTGIAPRKTGAAETSSAVPPRILSEAERALQERVEREMQLTLEAERSKVEDGHHGTMSALQLNFDDDVAEMRRADAARRATSLQQEEEERERRLQQTRSTCEENYGDELRSLEREAESYATKLRKLEAEVARATTGNTQRATVEAELNMALAKQRSDVEASAERQHEAAVAAARSVHAAAMQKVLDDEQERVAAVRQTRQRKSDGEERALALQVETERKRLEEQLKDLEGKLASVVARAGASTAAAAPLATSSSPPTGDEFLSERLARVTAARAVQLRDIEAATAREQSDVRSDGEATLAELAKRIESAQPAAQPLLTGTTPTSPLSRVASCSFDRSSVVTVQGGARPTPATLSVAFTQELNRIRLERGKERQERLAKLRTEREAALAAVEALPDSASSEKGRVSHSCDGADTAPNGGADRCRDTLEELKAAHMAALEAEKALYAKMEEDLKQRYAREAADAAGATAATEQSAVVARAVDAEMDLFVQEAAARYDRMRAEAEAKRNKALIDHRLAMEAYERRKLEMEIRQAREQREAQEAFIQDRLDTAVAAEKAKLAADHEAAMARLAVRYDEERDAVKAEVEEEMAAYEAAVRQQIMASASITAAPGDRKQAATSATVNTGDGTAALCSQAEMQHADQEAEWTSRKRIREAQRAALEEKQALMQTQQRRLEERVEALRKEVADLAATAPAASSQVPSLLAGSASSPPPAGSASASATNGSGHLRSVHEAFMEALEQGYRSQEAALEAELQVWRSKIRALQQSQPEPSSMSTGLSTPRHQVLAETAHPGGASVGLASTPYLLPYQPSPIASAAAGASLLNTPANRMGFEDSPWQPAARAGGTPPLQMDMVARSPFMATGVPSTTEAILSYEQRQRILQQRRASLEAAREAWQLHRRQRAELQQREQSRSNLAAFIEASGHDRRHYAIKPSTMDADDAVRRSRQELLSLFLSHLRERLDVLTGLAMQLPPPPQLHRRCQSATRASVHAPLASSTHARAVRAGSHHRSARGQPQWGSAMLMATPRPRHSTSLNTTAASEGRAPPPPGKRSSFPFNAKTSQFLSHNRSGKRLDGGEGEARRVGASPGNVSSKWDSLLTQYRRHRRR